MEVKEGPYVVSKDKHFAEWSEENCEHVPAYLDLLRELSVGQVAQLCNQGNKNAHENTTTSASYHRCRASCFMSSVKDRHPDELLKIQESHFVLGKVFSALIGAWQFKKKKSDNDKSNAS